MGFNLERNHIFLAVLLVLIFLAGFAVSYYTQTPVWNGPVCSFNGGEIVPIVNDQYPTLVLNEINSANSKINILMYEMRLYNTNNSVKKMEDALILATKRGVKVQVLLDQSEYQGRVTDLTKDNVKTMSYLQLNGVDVKMDSKKTTTHSKLVIIDDREVIVGSTNWGFSAFERNNEANVLIKNLDVVDYYQNYFDYVWKSS